MIDKEKFAKILDKITEASLLAIIFLVPIYFAWFQENFNIFELNKLIIFRIFLTAAALAWLGSLFLAGKLEYKINPKVFFLIMLLAAAFFVSTVFSLHPKLSLWGNYDRQQGFYSLISYLLFFVLFFLAVKDRLRIKRIIMAAVLSAALVVFYGLAQYFYLDPLAWKEGALFTGRIFSSLGQPNFLGQYLIMVLPLTAFAALFIFKKILIRFLLLLLAAAESAAILFTYSRGAWLGLLAGLFVFVVLFLFFKNCKKTALSLIVLAGLAILAIVALNFFPENSRDALVPVTVAARAKSIVFLNSGSNKMRLNYWQAALSEFKNFSWQRKLIGLGPETESSVFVKYYRPDWGVYEKINSWPDRAHNSIFDTLLQFGLFGLAAQLSLFSYLVILSFKYLKQSGLQKQEDYLALFILSPLAAYGVNNLFSFSLTAGFIYSYLCLGLLIVVVSENNQIKTFNLSFLKPFSRGLIWAACLVTGLIFVYAQNLKPLLADYYYMKVKQAEVRADCRGIFNNLDKVDEFYPNRTFYQERYIYHSLNCLNAVTDKTARDELLKNILLKLTSIEPEEYQYSAWQEAAHAYSLLGFYLGEEFYRQAEENYEEMIKLNPYITTAYKDYGRMQLWQKENDSAITNFKKGLAVTPPLNQPYLNDLHKREIKQAIEELDELLGQAYAQKKDWPAALSYYEAALTINPFYLPRYKEIADVYYQSGNLDKAIWYNKKGFSLNPKDYKWPFALALLYQEKGDKALALALAAQAARLAPAEPAIGKFIEELKR